MSYSIAYLLIFSGGFSRDFQLNRFQIIANYQILTYKMIQVKKKEHDNLCN